MNSITISRILILWACLMGSGLDRTKQAVALELGLTPSNVVGLWQDINRVFIEYQRDSGMDPALVAEIEAMKPKVFRGKRPRDVFARATAVYQVLHDSCGMKELPPPPDWVLEFQKREQTSEDTDTTPSEVYLLSARILNRLVEKYETDTHGTYPVSGFYRDHALKGKIPSDAFAMVDLLSRRLDLVISRSGSQPAAPEGK